MLLPTQIIPFCEARRNAIAREFQGLNPEQRRAVLTTEGPLLLLAGAGSGKTTVLIQRIANLMKYGSGSDSNDVPDWVTEDDLQFLQHYAHTGDGDPYRVEHLCKLAPPAPWQILAITFTNKAAGELKERLQARLGDGAGDIWASTFHSACVKILRRDIDKLGFRSAFTIYDTDDSLRVIKDCLKTLNFDDKQFVPRSVLGHISRAKDELLLAGDYLARAEKAGDFRQQKIGQIYEAYQKRLWDAGALDFDDIILHTVRLLQQNEEVRTFYQKKFKYVLIDEYQDTNNLQYLLASTLAGGHENFCVVGDDDQSIYRFRGATIENILSFEAQYQSARVIRLEQNYRSTGHILDASNAVIRHNQGRKGKELWTKAPQGDKLTLYTASNESDEANFIATTILEGYAQGKKWSDHAILYRMNAQSNQLENACKRNGIPYKIIGGTRFFDRAEVKDMVAYLAFLNNPMDDLRLGRIINNPPRGIGQRTIDIVTELAQRDDTSLFAIIDNVAMYPELQKPAKKLTEFAALIAELAVLSAEMPLNEFYPELIARTGYGIMLESKNTVEDRTRLENVNELLTSINGYLENAGDEPSLSGFLDEIALYTDLDSHDKSQDTIIMMTMHGAKGLEFPTVFVAGVEEGIFPGIRSIGEPEEMEEERRLCYVAMTRAKERLFLTCARQRMLFGRTSSNHVSRFTDEIPEEFLERTGNAAPSFDDGWGAPRTQATATIPTRTFQSGGSSFGGSTGGASYGGFRGAMQNKPARPAPTGGVKSAGGASTLPSYQQGDMVSHKAFGKGMVLSVQKMGGDALIEIAFDDKGTKRLMLKTAAAHLSKA